jgi:hypothetical protein
MSNLALDLRPQKLEDIIGQDAAKKAIKSFAERNNWPNVFIFYGPPGTGKTTFAEIVAKLIAGEDGDIHQINGSVQNKVEDARELSEIAYSCPFNGRPRVFIVNEFHRWTEAAMDAVKDTMEKSPCVWLLTTDVPEKISEAIKSRASAATFRLLPLKKEEIWHLINSATNKIDPTATTMNLLKHGVTSPREILGVLDQLLAGVPFEQAVHGSEHEPIYSEISNAVLSGNWTRTSGLLKQIKTADYRAMVSVVSAKLSWALLDESVGPRGDAIATCLVGLGANQFADGVAYSSLKALLYKCCKALQSK